MKDPLQRGMYPPILCFSPRRPRQLRRQTSALPPLVAELVTVLLEIHQIDRGRFACALNLLARKKLQDLRGGQ